MRVVALNYSDRGRVVVRIRSKNQDRAWCERWSEPSWSGDVKVATGIAGKARRRINQLRGRSFDLTKRRDITVHMAEKLHNLDVKRRRYVRNIDGRTDMPVLRGARSRAA